MIFAKEIKILPPDSLAFLTRQIMDFLNLGAQFRKYGSHSCWRSLVCRWLCYILLRGCLWCCSRLCWRCRAKLVPVCALYKFQRFRFSVYERVHQRFLIELDIVLVQRIEIVCAHCLALIFRHLVDLFHASHILALVLGLWSLLRCADLLRSYHLRYLRSCFLRCHLRSAILLWSCFLWCNLWSYRLRSGCLRNHHLRRLRSRSLYLLGRCHIRDRLRSGSRNRILHPLNGVCFLHRLHSLLQHLAIQILTRTFLHRLYCLHSLLRNQTEYSRVILVVDSLRQRRHESYFIVSGEALRHLHSDLSRLQKSSLLIAGKSIYVDMRRLCLLRCLQAEQIPRLL